MPERAGREETVRAGTPLRVGDVILVAIERVVVRSGRAPAGMWATAAVEPQALVVRDARGVRVVDLDGTAPSLERLREAIPGLDGLLATPDRPPPGSPTAGP